MTFLRLLIPAAALGAAACTAAVSAGKPDGNQTGPVSCEVAVAEAGRGVNIQALVHGTADTSGQFRFAVSGASGGGSTRINQGGSFHVAAGETRTLGQATLGGSAASYDAELTLEVDGQTIACTPDPEVDL